MYSVGGFLFTNERLLKFIKYIYTFYQDAVRREDLAICFWPWNPLGFALALTSLHSLFAYGVPSDWARQGERRICFTRVGCSQCESKMLGTGLAICPLIGQCLLWSAPVGEPQAGPLLGLASLCQSYRAPSLFPGAAPR